MDSPDSLIDWSGCGEVDLHRPDRRASAPSLTVIRAFAQDDTPQSPRVAILNWVLAKKLFGTLDVIGKRCPANPGKEIEVVVLVEDGKYSTLVEDHAPPLFWPTLQRPESSTVLLVCTRPHPLGPPPPSEPPSPTSAAASPSSPSGLGPTPSPPSSSPLAELSSPIPPPCSATNKTRAARPETAGSSQTPPRSNGSWPPETPHPPAPRSVHPRSQP